MQKITYEGNFSIAHDLLLLKKEGKIIDFNMNTFKTETKRVISILRNDILATISSHKISWGIFYGILKGQYPIKIFHSYFENGPDLIS